jgi:hypothetical protein
MALNTRPDKYDNEEQDFGILYKYS